jgi:hypothetical protein
MVTATTSPWLAAADHFDPQRDERSRDRSECAADPETFIERHVTIEDPDGTVRPFALWDFQRDAVRTIIEQQAVIVLKARRLGLSWVVLAYALWLAIFHQGIRILLLCKTGDDAAELLDRIRRMRDRIADNPAGAHILDGLVRGAKDRDAVTTLDIGASTIRALMGTPAAARSETAGFVILDEFGFQRGAADIWQAILPTIEGGGRIAVVSTGNGGPQRTGVGQEFARQWTRANSGESGHAALFFPWMVRPERDDAWYQTTLQSIGDPERMRVEYPAEPADAFISPDTLFAFDTAAIDAAVRLGAKLDEQRAAGTLPPPADRRLAVGVDWGDFRSHAVPVWELERGGLYIPPGEVATTQADVEDISRAILNAVGQYHFWFGEERYDSAFKQSNRTFVRTAEQLLGPHNPMRRTGRPNTVPVSFAAYKSLCVSYLRILLRRTLAGEETRVLAISPANTVLIEQMRDYQQTETGKFEKGNDDAVDSLIAGVQPLAKKHRDLVDREDSTLAREAA